MFESEAPVGEALFPACLQNYLNGEVVQSCLSRIEAGPGRVGRKAHPLPREEDGIECSQLRDAIICASMDCGMLSSEAASSVFASFLDAAVLLIWDWFRPEDSTVETLALLSGIERITSDVEHTSPFAMIFEQIETGTYPVWASSGEGVVRKPTELINNRTGECPYNRVHRAKDGRVVRGLRPEDDRALAAYERYLGSIRGRDWLSSYHAINLFAGRLAKDVGVTIPEATPELLMYRKKLQLGLQIRKFQRLGSSSTTPNPSPSVPLGFSCEAQSRARGERTPIMSDVPETNIFEELYCSSLRQAVDGAKPGDPEAERFMADLKAALDAHEDSLGVAADE